MRWQLSSRPSARCHPPSSLAPPTSRTSATCTGPWPRSGGWVAGDRGTIVQVGSALAYRAIPLQSAYCGAKFAVRGFTDSVRTELMHDRSWEMTALVDDDDDQHEPSTVAPTARRSRRPLQQTTETIKEDYQ